ncbi:MAG: methyltransferase [Planctomycetota bacterium]|nr:methyltransferase [Planctomycetota bacterium]
MLLVVGVVDQGSLALDLWVRAFGAALLDLPAIYTLYCVARFFGFRRALGIDHFDATYRKRPLVAEGSFRWTANGMYLFGFLTLWAIAVACASSVALVAAGFSHLYIWVHYCWTEKPGMQWIYGSR